MASSPERPLTQSQKDFFLTHGYLHIPSCFTRTQASDVLQGVWTRLNMSPTDKSTWRTSEQGQGRIHMPSHRSFDASVFVPKAWSAICDLCGGSDRITPSSSQWRDSLIVNLGTPGGEAEKPPVAPKDLNNWHVDGDFFVHYLDSPEQGLLVIPLFTDVIPDGGGTVICPDAIAGVARWLYEHPEGVSPRMVPRGHGDFDQERNLDWYRELVGGCEEFVEVVGGVGDVYLVHPLMVHSASRNARREFRVITNPPVSLREPFCFDRADGGYSLVELKTLRSLGVEAGGGLKRWRITGERERIVPQRVRVQEALKREERKRLEESDKAGATA
ncbi:uncharacterized protein BCR38DRAFT_345012 [Pseudomassariella vexata]|uniref:Phytanoyl-CoA dioxygenase n=1 Tax=Pseudomassariella vexata TaxID=1141098 RepID=A0A1Y2DWA6_9PEZI|nr:uncharacterized protein BCR38DRAFT_345012 [Pseudomassariella vexata]ORY63426.1 hypothetical protein BCR38DRAFT_345012 [Pseudomassariella vexata]